MTRSTPRALALLALMGALVVFAGVFGAPGSAAASPVAPLACEARAGGATVAVVVDFGGGRVRTRCAEPGGTGIDVLRRAGFAPVTAAYGSEGGAAAVCAVIDPDTQTLQGCDAGPSCLTCQQPDSWVYFPGYRYSQVGAGSTQPGAGRVEAWRWGRSMTWPGAKPTAGELCGQVAPPPTPTTAAPAPAPGGSTAPSPGGGTPGGGSGGGSSGGPGPVAGPGPGPGGGSAVGGGSGPGAGEPGRSDPSAPDAGGSTTAPDAEPTTTAEDAEDAEDGPTTTGGAAEVDAAGAERPGDGDAEQAGGVVSSAAGDAPGGGSGGAPVVPLALTGLVVAAVAALALRARRSRAAGAPTAGDTPHAPA